VQCTIVARSVKNKKVSPHSQQIKVKKSSPSETSNKTVPVGDRVRNGRSRPGPVAVLSISGRAAAAAASSQQVPQSHVVRAPAKDEKLLAVFLPPPPFLIFFFFSFLSPLF
jgi:hypothetical protein